jgi:hypothetical protein
MAWHASVAKAGLHPCAMPWLADGSPIHVLGINAMRLLFLDALNLDELAGHCANLRRWKFFFVVPPILLSGASGRVVNPLAIF